MVSSVVVGGNLANRTLRVLMMMMMMTMMMRVLMMTMKKNLSHSVDEIEKNHVLVLKLINHPDDPDYYTWRVL